MEHTKPSLTPILTPTLMSGLVLLIMVDAIGLEKCTVRTTEKSVKCKEIIKKHARDFWGMLSDPEVMTLCKISRNSYYKYKREIKAP